MSATEHRATPRRLTAYVTALCAVGVAGAVANAVTQPLAMTGDQPWIGGILVAAMVLGLWAPLRFQHRGGVQGFTVEEGILLAMLFTLPVGVPPLLYAGGALLGHALRNFDRLKVSFNVGHSALASVAAALTFHAIWNPPARLTADYVLEPNSILAGVVAIIVYNLVNALAVGGLFKQLEGRPLRQTLSDVWRLYILTGGGNYLFGLLLAFVVIEDLLAAIPAFVLMAGVHLGYRGYASALEERRRNAQLREVTRYLAGAAGSDDAAERFLEELARLFRADAAELARPDGGTIRVMLRDGGHVVGERTLVPEGLLTETIRRGGSIQADEGDASLGAWLRQLGHREAIAAPMIHDGRTVGAIAVYDRRGLEAQRGGDLNLLASLANEASVALRNVDLFASVERERASLQEESRKLSEIVGAASDGIALVDASGRILTWNPAMEQATGIASTEALGQPWFMALRLRDAHGDDLPVDGAGPMQAALTGERSSERVDLQAMRRDGEWRWLQCTFSPVEREGEGVVGVVMVAYDVTRERETEEMKADFIATVSHELRTPLTPLKGFLLTLVDSAERIEPDQRVTFYDSMLRQVERLESLVGDLLVVADLDRGGMRMHTELVPLAGATSEALATIRSAYDPARVMVEADDDVTVVGDRTAIVRILRALVDNAVKHTSGTVTVHVARDGDNAVVAVHDEGPGISTDHQRRVFERFTRLGDHLTRTTQGSGLGLSIARSLAERLGGHLELSSTPGAGSTFSFVLPAARPMAVQNEQTARSPIAG